MQMLVKSCIKLFLGTVAGISLFSLLLPQSIWAQTATEVNPLQDFDPQLQNQDPFSSDSDPVGSIFDLMHRAQQGNIRSANEYSAEQDKVINDAAAQFRSMQLQRIQKQQQGNQNNSVQIQQVTEWVGSSDWWLEKI